MDGGEGKVKMTTEWDKMRKGTNWKRKEFPHKVTISVYTSEQNDRVAVISIQGRKFIFSPAEQNAANRRANEILKKKPRRK